MNNVQRFVNPRLNVGIRYISEINGLYIYMCYELKNTETLFGVISKIIFYSYKLHKENIKSLFTAHDTQEKHYLFQH